MSSYPIIANCNFDSRDDDKGKAIHAARKAVDAGLTDDADLLAALDELEDVLAEHADDDHVHAVEACRTAENAVVRTWTAEVREAVEAERVSRYVD